MNPLPSQIRSAKGALKFPGDVTATTLRKEPQLSHFPAAIPPASTPALASTSSGNTLTDRPPHLAPYGFHLTVPFRQILPSKAIRKDPS
jgi:hypothetical protein